MEWSGRRWGPSLDPSLSKLSWSFLLPPCWGWSWGSRMETAGLASTQVLLSSLLRFYVQRNSALVHSPGIPPLCPGSPRVWLQHGHTPPSQTGFLKASWHFRLRGAPPSLPHLSLTLSTAELAHGSPIEGGMWVSLPFSKATPYPAPPGCIILITARASVSCPVPSFWF